MAVLVRVFGDIELAEDAVQEAFAAALERWPATGPPPDPPAWVLTTARHRAIDRLRRESLGRSLIADAIDERAAGVRDPDPSLEPLDDDPLRLIFTCCHPALGQDAQVALTLRLLGGLSTREVAAAFLVEESAMAQRLVRAKRKIKSAPIPYRVPRSDELPERLPPVLAVLYLIYNAGADRPPGRDADELCAEGLRLARLMQALMPSEPEAAGLVALILFASSRRAARFADDGELVRLRDQNRASWDRVQIREANGILRGCREQSSPGPYQLQAAIQSVHAVAPSIEATRWDQIVLLYDELLRLTDSPIVALNRAIAVAEVDGPATALNQIDALDLEGYHLLHAARADLLARLERASEAAEAYGRAAELCASPAESAFLRARRARLLGDRT